ncbi:hypothetical protein [Actinokineospora diospyrosa]|uniref:ATP-binding protein n=1 Tax=Actinokineospora diospyrosa TaxID=103728 RepID=A0ABT1I5Y4_9PSEU|nr:hypothetical protein [Actinokineospora diospyrosa]MCP2268045.1 hypothetical protein [Actinokineospora diospyrosa]
MDIWHAARATWAANAEPLLGKLGGRPASLVIKRRYNFLVRPAVGIAITGMRGTGKSFLHQALRQRFQLGQPVLEGESADYERDRFVTATGGGKRHVELVVVPGQKDSEQGRRTRDRYFANGNAPTGVVHVVSWGFSKIWDEDLQRVAIAESAALPATDPRAMAHLPELVEQARAHNLRGELDDLRQTRSWLESSWESRSGPLWLVIVLAMPDLLHRNLPDPAAARAADAATLAAVGGHYLPSADPGRDSEFAREVRALVNFVGENRFGARVAMMPVISFRKPFTVGGVAIPSHGDDELVATLMSRFSNRIGVFCDGG